MPEEYEKVVAARGGRRLIGGELNPIFQGAYSSRIELKQTMRSLESLLGSAEKLAAVVRSQHAGAEVASAALWQAWEPALFNVTHDLASGVMTDHVYEDTLSSYQFSERLGEELLEDGLAAASRPIDTTGQGSAIVVWNTLGWPRSDLVQLDLGFSEPGVEGVQVRDAAGREVPVQVREIARSPAGLLQAEVSFIARDVPAMGYCVYHASPLPLAGEGGASGGRQAPEAVPAGQAPAASGGRQAPEGVAIENEYYQLRLNPRTGALTSLKVKAGDWEALAGPANVVSRSTTAATSGSYTTSWTAAAASP